MRTNFGQIAGWLVGLWAVYMTVGSLGFWLRTRNRLRRDPIGWLRKHGVGCESGRDIEVMWLEGQVAFPNYLRIPAIAAVLTADRLVLECQVPTFVRRGRQVIGIEATLRLKDGAIADPKRRCLVASRPPETLIDRLQERGWHIKGSSDLSGV